MRCLTSIFTTAGDTRAAALTTVREYPSSKTESSWPAAAVSMPLLVADGTPESISFRRKSIGTAFSFVRDAIVICKFRTLKPAVNYISLSLIHTFENVTLRLRVNGNCFTQRRAKGVLHPFRLGCAVSFPARARPNCRQMDSSHYPDSGARNDALCRATARDRGHFAKNADPDAAQPRARWPGATHRSSRCPSEGGVLSHEIGPNLDRTIARALPLVGKTS